MIRRSYRIAVLSWALAAAAAPAQSPIIHRYAAGAAGLFVNAYLVETPHGVVAIDATLTESDSKALRAKLDSLGKPLLAVLLTHGHPDHYNGVTNLVAGREAPVLATAGVDSVIRASDAAKEAQWRPVFKDEWPPRRMFPTRIVRDGASVTLDGATFTTHALGPGESHQDSYWVLDGAPHAAFIGDVVLNRVHAYTAERTHRRVAGQPRAGAQRATAGRGRVPGSRRSGWTRHAGLGAALPDHVPGGGRRAGPQGRGAR